MNLDISLPDATYANIGRIATGWAKIETAIDLMNTVIYSWHGARGYEKRIPIALEAKAKFLRRAAQRISTMAPYKDEAVSLANSVLEDKIQRHLIIHAAPLRYVEGELTYFQLSNLNDNMAYSEVPISDQALANFALKSFGLGAQAWGLCKRFTDDWMEQSKQVTGTTLP